MAGATTPEFMLISTPAAREDAHISRKRRFIFDDLTVLPNMYVMVNLDYHIPFSQFLLRSLMIVALWFGYHLCNN